jgi:DNA-directed RNA polymerase beta' subunit
MKYSNGNRTNRQPSLHEYSIFALKVRLVEGYAIHFPIAICSPLNAKQNWCFKIPLNAGNSR